MANTAHSNKWARLPGRLALLLGLGALSAGAARADTGAPPPDPGASRNHAAALGDAVIRAQGDRIYLSQRGEEFYRLPLADTPETRRLLALLHASDPASDGLRLRPTLFAGDGGAGFHWTPSHEPKRPTTHRISVPKKDSPQPLAPPQGAPRDSGFGGQGAKG